jgi:hypothetical protein
VAKRWRFWVGSAAILLTMLVALVVGAPSSQRTVSACGGTRLPDGTCVGIPMPGDPYATCVPQSGGSCTWYWKSPYVPH